MVNILLSDLVFIVVWIVLDVLECLSLRSVIRCIELFDDIVFVGIIIVENFETVYRLRENLNNGLKVSELRLLQ